jgi:hypothetical protein
MPDESIASKIHRAVSSWAGVTVKGHPGGILFFFAGAREIGHLHGNRFADLPFPVRIRKMLVEQGKAGLHYLHPRSGWVTCHFRDEQDVERILELFQLNYERPWLAVKERSA